MLRESHSRNRRGKSRWDAARPDGTRSHRPGHGAPSLSLFLSLLGGEICGGEFVFLSQFSSVFCSSSSRLKSVLNTCTHRRESGGPFDQPLRKVPQIPGISVAGALGNIIGLVRRHKARGTF